MKKLFLLFLLLVLTACGLPIALPIGEATPVSTATVAALETQPLPSATALPASETPVPDLSLDVLRNFTYWLQDFNAKAVLEDGSYTTPMNSGEPGQKLTGQMIEPAAIGDLNGDGRPDAAVILTIHSGGTGTFFDLIVLLNQDGVPVQSASTMIGDRQGVRDLQIADGKITLDFLTQGPDDPLCCPSQHRMRSYLFENGMLQIVSDQVVE